MNSRRKINFILNTVEIWFLALLILVLIFLSNFNKASAALACYWDFDGDGYGSVFAGSYDVCPVDRVPNYGDCDDSNPSVYTGTTRTRYQSSAQTCGTACQSEVQTCQGDGTWSGTYTDSSCTASTRQAYEPFNSACGTYYCDGPFTAICTLSGWSPNFPAACSITTQNQYNPLTSACGTYDSSAVTAYCQANGSWSPTGSCGTSPCSVSTQTTYNNYSSSCGYYSCSGPINSTCTSGGWSPPLGNSGSSCNVATRSGYTLSSVCSPDICSSYYGTDTCLSTGWSGSHSYGSCSVISCVTPPAAPNLSSTDTSLTGLTKNRRIVTLVWNDITNEDGYEILRSIKNRATGSYSSPTLIASKGANITSHQIIGLDCPADYRFVVRAVNTAGSADSNVIEVKTRFCTYNFFGN